MSSTDLLLERMVVALESGVQALQRIAENSSRERPTPPSSREERRLKALSLMPECGGNLAEVARQIGCSRKTLYADRKLVEAFDRYRAGLSMVKGSPRRGRSAAEVAVWDEKDLE